MKYTRAILDAIHNGELNNAEYTETDIFRLRIPTAVTGVPSEILNPAESWKNKQDYKSNLLSLASLFAKNFSKYQNEKSDRLLKGGPQIK